MHAVISDQNLIHVRPVLLDKHRAKYNYSAFSGSLYIRVWVYMCLTFKEELIEYTFISLPQ